MDYDIKKAENRSPSSQPFRELFSDVDNFPRYVMLRRKMRYAKQRYFHPKQNIIPVTI